MYHYLHDVPLAKESAANSDFTASFPSDPALSVSPLQALVSYQIASDDIYDILVNCLPDSCACHVSSDIMMEEGTV